MSEDNKKPNRTSLAHESGQLNNNQSSGLETAAQKEVRLNKNFYKRAWFWILIVVGIITIIGGILLGIYFSSQAKNKQIILQGWHDIVQQADRVNDLVVKVDSKESFNSYTSELQNLNRIVSDKKFNAQKMKYKAQDAQSYEIFLDDFSKYTQESVKYAGNINDFTEDNADSLNNLAGIAKESSNNLKNNASYLSETMPNEIFDIAKTLTEVHKTLLTKELANKAKQLAEQAASAKDTADKKAVEATVGNFFNAYIAGNAATMRRYMTEAFQKEYDFNQLTPEARQYSYPASFRILTNQKVDNERYKVQANVVYKLRDGSGQYTVGSELNVIYNSASATWLVDNVKEGTSF
jgi:hypothetical protein